MFAIHVLHHTIREESIRDFGGGCGNGSHRCFAFKDTNQPSHSQPTFDHIGEERPHRIILNLFTINRPTIGENCLTDDLRRV
jgi:hypothetical protein